MMEDFLRLASQNTRKNLETCGVLAGSLVRDIVILCASKFQKISWDDDFNIFCTCNLNVSRKTGYFISRHL